MGRPAFLDHQLQRIILVVNDLLVVEQLEESIVGNVFVGLVGAAAEKDREADQRERDGDENDAAPIKIRLVTARLVVLL